ncbi:6-bladed beta-propeller [Millionella massiliensis]|uniref:6-bladed beta-propeller n=1 Tax=Millionella massiliensis TaxID=1871023 RepID=UPI0008D9493D|nr:6-bladed beta-propeller [Millionella massiliensis]
MKNKRLVFSWILSGMLCVLMCGCGSKGNQPEVSTEGGEEIILEEISTVPVHQRIDSVWCVPLETTDSSLVSNVLAVEVMDDRFYVLDRSCASILIFDKQGRYLGGIYDQGPGPKEYTRIVDMKLDRLNKQILVTDQFSKKLLVYDSDGNWVKTVPFVYCEGIVVPFKGGRYVQVNDGREQFLPDDMRPWNLTLFDDQGHPLANWLQDQTPSRVDFAVGKNVCTLDNGELLFSPLFSSVFYRVGEDSIVPAYRLVNRLDGYKSLSESDLQNMNYVHGDEQCSYKDYLRRSYVLPGTFLNNDHYLCASLNVGDKPCYVLYDKENGRTEVISFERGTQNDIRFYSVDDVLKRLFNRVPLCIDGKAFYVELSHVHKLMMGDKDPGPKFGPIYDALGENDNPVLVGYTLKPVDEE